MGISYGVIVGRFQVNNLHAGHLDLFRQVSELHDRVIVFIGVARTLPTKRNPLDFETRKKMIQAEYPDFTILPLRDEKYDQFWSDHLDESIASVTQFTGNVTLYGGRDSFVPHYYGVHKVKQLEISGSLSGTEIRDKLTNRVMQSSDFRAGAIYAITNQFPRTIPTVDIAIFHDTGTELQMLLAKKPGENLYRFPGGFAEAAESLEANAKREAYEETKLHVESLSFLGTFPIKDWRYAQDTDAGIITIFFAGWTMTRNAVASDDISEVHWFNYDQLPPVVEAAHMPLLEAARKYMAKRGYNAAQRNPSN